jgi:putative spermidine/putrescine transport system permease protein
MIGATRRAAALWSWLVVLALNLPILVVVIISFSSEEYFAFPPPGFSLRWYLAFFSASDWLGATARSFEVGLATMLLATPLGVLGSFGLVRGRFPGRRLIMVLVNAPLVVPSIAVAVALYFFAARLGLVGTLSALIAAHVALTVPLIVATVSGALSAFDLDLERAAANLGADRWRIFWFITRPQIQPAIFSGALFAFLMSFDELIVALFISGVTTQTLPVRMWGSLRDHLDPTIAAISTVLIVLSAVILIGAQSVGRRAAAPKPPG